MHVIQYVYKDGLWHCQNNDRSGHRPHLTLIFGDRRHLADQAGVDAVIKPFTAGVVVTCSTAGHILGAELHEASLVATSIRFDHSSVVAMDLAAEDRDALEVGEEIGIHARALGPALRLVYVLSDGRSVNGSDLLKGIHRHLPEGVMVAGGLAGDGDRFESTLVGIGGVPRSGHIVVIAFLGEALDISAGVSAGWDPFGPERTITASDKNRLQELDGCNALGLYKQYLGPRAEELPGSALLFPLEITEPGAGEPVIRTILGIDDPAGTMTFAGNVPEGARARFMCANFDRLIESAADAAAGAMDQRAIQGPQLALLVSCVGRRLVLGQRVEEELEMARQQLGPDTAITGFYSYGEIAPVGHGAQAQLHNQTMAITTIRERAA